MTGIIKTDKLQSSAGNDALTIASNGSITSSVTSGTTSTFTSTQASTNADILKLNATQTNSSSNLKFQINGGSTAQGQIRLGGNNDISIHNTSSDTERLRILSSGGITFNGDTAAANALDDYEEGTWTPTDASGAGMTLIVWQSIYTKIGRKVFVEIGFKLPSNSSTADLKIGGLPYVSIGGGDNTGGFALSGTNSGRSDLWLVDRGLSSFGAGTYNNVSAKNNNYSNNQIKLCGSYTTA
jgi:hypothetical protein